MKRRILVVDDEKDMLALLRRIITEKTEYDAVLQNNPSKAVEMIEQEPFDLVITDLKMPKMDGIALLE
ncbi:MAG: response regulator [Desulfobacterales bacterium]|nr:MAG: response regulator [Desulfobacterales bacterium]